jgi:hypothetical protein
VAAGLETLIYFDYIVKTVRFRAVLFKIFVRGTVFQTEIFHGTQPVLELVLLAKQRSRIKLIFFWL